MSESVLQQTQLSRRWMIVVLGIVIEIGLLVPLLVWNIPSLHIPFPLGGEINKCNQPLPQLPIPKGNGIDPRIPFSNTLTHISTCDHTIRAISVTTSDIILTTLLAALFACAGILIFLRSQDRPTARVTYGLFMTTSLLCCFFPVLSYNIVWVSLLFVNLSNTITGLGTTFIFLFPHTASYRPNQARSARLAYLPLWLGGALLIFNILLLSYPSSLYRVFTVLTIGYNLTCLVLVIWTLLWGLRTVNNNEQQLASMIMIGVACLLIIAGFTSLGILNLGLPSLPGSNHDLWHLFPIPLMILPIICDYAFFRDQLIGTTSLLSRKGLRIFLWLLLACVFIFPTIVLMRTIREIQPAWVNYVYAILIIISLYLFPLIWNKLRDVGDSVFYHDFYQYNRELQKLSTGLTRLRELDQVGDFILPKLAVLLNATEVALFIRATSQDEMNYSSNQTTQSWHIYHHIAGESGQTAGQLRGCADKALLQLKKRTHEPLLVNGVLLLALYAGDQISGFLCLGAKKNKEPYGRQDHSFLATLAAQLSFVEANNRYLEQARADAQRLAALNHRVISAQEEERMHLALDLHDDVLQEAMLLVRQLSDASHMSDVGDAMPLARSVVTNLRRTCLALRPSLLEELGLAEALHWLARQTEQLNSNKLSVRVCYGSEAPMERVAETIELAFYRVAQEALANVSKHSHATQVIVRLKQDSARKCLSLLILDNGQGFRRDNPRRENLGIVGMYERMEAIGGNIQLRTHIGLGTVVRATYQDTSDNAIYKHTQYRALNEENRDQHSGEMEIISR